MIGLTMKELCSMPFVNLAAIINSDTVTQTDRLKAANALHMRAAAEMSGAGWMILARNEKAMIRQAMTFDTTGESDNLVG